MEFAEKVRVIVAGRSMPQCNYRSARKQLPVAFWLHCGRIRKVLATPHNRKESKFRPLIGPLNETRQGARVLSDRTRHGARRGATDVPHRVPTAPVHRLPFSVVRPRRPRRLVRVLSCVWRVLSCDLGVLRRVLSVLSCRLSGPS